MTADAIGARLPIALWLGIVSLLEYNPLAG
jgi:hypothetical protein